MSAVCSSSELHTVYSREKLQAERSKGNPIPHETLVYSFCNEGSATIGCGDIGILHNVAMLFKSKNIEDKYMKAINRFHITVRTMRRSVHWDWVKPNHIQLILAMMDEIYKHIDEFVLAYKEAQQFYLEGMDKAVEMGVMSEGDYLDCVNGLKKPYDFITGSDFKEWMKGRSDLYQSLNGAMPKIQLIQLPQFNQHDGKAFIITA